MSKNNIEHIEAILSNLPRTPWVYQMKDKWGKVMYVWKAKNLKNRVSSYFVKTNDLSVAKKQMVWKIADIEILLCETEVEALILETNIIKHLSPKYNILMKDDKNLAYLKITNSPVPELIKTRQKFRDGWEYFGPYVSSVEESVRSLRRIFRIRNCRVKFEKRRDTLSIIDKSGKTIPCMDYYIGLCPAPCLLEKPKVDEHNENVNKVKTFLSWWAQSLFSELEISMKEKARNFQFEEAQKIKETIDSLKWLHERQMVSNMIDGDVDIFMKYEKYDKTYVWLTQLRWWKIVWVFRHEAILGADEEEDILTSFLTRQYLDGDNLPSLLLLGFQVEDESFSSFLLEKWIQYEVPKIWPKHDLLDFTLNQVREYAYKKELAKLETKILTREHMVHILEKLGYEVPLKWEIVFECYDISHTDWHFTYASRVSIVNGKSDTSRYKKYKIKSLVDWDIDDFASHKEVMFRRTLEWLELNNFPHLIIIDGGKGQLSSAMRWIEEWKISYNSTLNVVLPQVCSIAKREEEIFLPWKKIPVLFDVGSPELMVLQKARDESHRFSITANKTARMKSMKKNILEELPWFGPVTRKKLLKLAGTVDDIKNINLEEIEKICTKTQIETLRDHGIIEL
jgi:excinuclease ABC subunit C